MYIGFFPGPTLEFQRPTRIEDPFFQLFSVYRLWVRGEFLSLTWKMSACLFPGPGVEACVLPELCV